MGEIDCNRKMMDTEDSCYCSGRYEERQRILQVIDLVIGCIHCLEKTNHPMGRYCLSEELKQKIEANK